MKVTTFASCVIFVSFLSNTTSNISLKNNQASRQVCAEKVIQTIFGDEPLYYVYKESSDLLPFNIRNSRAVGKVGSYKHHMKGKISNNLIFEVRNLRSFKHYFFFLRFMGIWGMHEPVKAKFLIITDHVWRVETIFRILWRYGFTYVAVLVINKDEDARSLLFTANPHDVQNYCGKLPNKMHVQSCDVAITDTIPRYIRDYHGCSVEFRSTLLTEHLDKFNRKDLTVITAVEMLNVSLKKPQNDHDWILLSDGLLYNNLNGGPHMSHIYTRDVIVWVVPLTNPISALEILAVNFDKEVWILVSVVFALFVLAWYVFDKFKTSLGEIVLKTFGITLSGSTSRIAKSSRLRFLILCYIVYSVHIQTAYVSNLMRLMTSPPTEQPIRNLKELLDADIPICLASSAQAALNGVVKVKDNVEIYQKILLRSCPIKSFNPRVLLELWSTRPNFSIAIALKTLHAQALNIRLRTPNYFFDNYIVNPLMLTFRAFVSSSIIDSLNIIINRLTESGLYDKLDRDRKSYEDSQERELPQEEVVALSLEHLNGIFIIFCFGMALSVMAFIGELIAHRFSM